MFDPEESPSSSLSESPIEELFWTELVKKVCPEDLSLLRQQHPAGGYRLDFAIPERMVCFELDGHDYHKTKKQRTHDARRDRFLLAQGWKVARFTGSEIYQNTERCVKEAMVLGGLSSCQSLVSSDEQKAVGEGPFPDRLEGEAPLYSRSSANEKQLFTTIRERDLEKTAQLIEEYPELTRSKNEVGITPLYIVARIPWPIIVDQLMECGADVDAPCPLAGNDFAIGDTPLIGAIQSGCLVSLRLLIDHGAKLDFVNGWHYTPLTVAIEYHRLEAMELLLKAGADPNLGTMDGLRALHIVAMSSDGDGLAFAKLLLAYGADPRAEVKNRRPFSDDDRALTGLTGLETIPVDFTRPGTALHDLLSSVS